MVVAWFSVLWLMVGFGLLLVLMLIVSRLVVDIVCYLRVACWVYC